MRNSLLILLLYISTTSIAQPIVRNDTGKHVIHWAPIRENDILWRKTVWRRIDIYQQLNWPFRAHSGTPPQNMFANVLLSGIRTSKYSAYKGADTGFATAMTIYDLNALVQCDAAKLPERERQYINFRKAHAGDTADLAMPAIDSKMGFDTTAVTSCDYPQQVRSYRIKEEWIFDRNRGAVVVRIQGIGPEVMINDSLQVLFWVKYPESREHAAQFAVYRRSSDSLSYTWDEYFEMRQFSSKIIKTERAATQQSDMAEPKQPPDGVKRKKKKDRLSKKEAELWNY